MNFIEYRFSVSPFTDDINFNLLEKAKNLAKRGIVAGGLLTAALNPMSAITREGAQAIVDHPRTIFNIPEGDVGPLSEKDQMLVDKFMEDPIGIPYRSKAAMLDALNQKADEESAALSERAAAESNGATLALKRAWSKMTGKPFTHLIHTYENTGHDDPLPEEGRFYEVSEEPLGRIRRTTAKEVERDPELKAIKAKDAEIKAWARDHGYGQSE